MSKMSQIRASVRPQVNPDPSFDLFPDCSREEVLGDPLARTPDGWRPLFSRAAEAEAAAPAG